uniref:Tectonin beta-propeller repeat-containing protein 2-like n=1 Tax=Sinocyclocheilus rhinocerous TaxID=307959 RepID=A0A673MBL2_9TELE
MATYPAPLPLREFCPLYYLLNAIPAKVQKGFRSVLVYLTALDSNSDYMAIGSSIGMLYLYCRRVSQMNKYNIEGKCEAITAVKLLNCFDDLVAVGTASGRVAFFQLVSPLPGRNKQLRRFDVVGLHKSTITALAWSANGMKLFSGDDKGRVVYSSVDLDQGVCNPVVFFEEPSAIVQLEYSQKVLLVSSHQRSMLFYTQEQSHHQLGTKPRKSNGKFGACFQPALCKQSDLVVYAARPGLRLWRTDVRGRVGETHVLKPLFNQDIPQFELFPRSGFNGGYRPSERQLGIVSCFLKEGWVLSWNEYSVYVVDCTNQVIIGGLESSGDIVSVSCTENEIFILKGDRDILRISNCPEGLVSNCELHHLVEALEVAEDSEQQWASLGTMESRSSSVTSWESAQGMFTATEASTSELSSSRYSTITQEDFQQELVVKAIKLKKKGKRRRQGKRINTLKDSEEDFKQSLHGDFNLDLSYDPIRPLGYSPEPEPTPSSDEEDIYAHGVPSSASLGDGLNALSLQSSSAKQEDEETQLLKADQLAESWMGYTGPGCGILSLVVTDRHIWCLDFKGGLFCSGLPNGSLSWQKFEENVHQVALSPSGSLLWKVEQKTMTAYACGKVTIKGKRHWYKALDDTAFVALGDDTAWIIRSNGDLYIQTGLCVDRPCARSVKVDCPCPMTQIAARGSVVWALSEQRGVFYREGLSSYCAEGEHWKYDTVSESQGLEPICIALGENNTVWAFDTSGNLWFRTGVTAKNPQGEDDHWWQVSITDYVVFDQGSLFQTLIQATQTVATATRAPVERVAERLRVAFLSQHSQCQPSLISVSTSGVWIASGRNEFHVAKGSLIGTFWKSIVPRGTASATKWAFVFSSAVPAKEGSFLWLGQSRKDLFCIWDKNLQMRPFTIQFPPDIEMVQLSACRDALWGLDHYGRVHIRTLSASCSTGMHWTLLDLSQLGHVKFLSLSCGSQNIWACDRNGMVYFRVGTQPLNPSMMLPAWICIEPPEQPAGLHLVKIQTSPNDRMLWALDNRGNVHVRVGITEEMPVGTAWEHIPGLQARQLVLSMRTAWVRLSNGEVARRYGITERNPAGDYWKKIPGLVSWLAVTPMDELWAVAPTGALNQRLTKTLQNNRSKNHGNVGSLSGEELEEEWEVI